MKLKMKRQRQTELPRFIVGALATAGASVANGATVQITFDNNVVSSLTGSGSFNGDLTGDLVVDAVGQTNVNGAWVFVPGYSQLAAGGRSFFSGMSFGFITLGGVRGEQADGADYVSLRGLVSLRFTDLRINGNMETYGWADLEVWGSRSGTELGKVQIHRLIFDEASTSAPTGVTSPSTGIQEWSATSAVPEASTSLGLLALGAGGLLTRRRSKRAA